MSAFDSTFRAAIPGQSLTGKLGSLPHEKPPKYVDPQEALEYFWKQLHRKEILKQIWQILESGATVWAITRAILYKAALEGIIQLNLAIVLYQAVGSMIAILGKKKGIKVTVNPKFRDPIKDKFMNDQINEKLGQSKQNKIPPSALKASIIPKPEEITARAKSNGAAVGKSVGDDKAGGLLGEIQASKGIG